MRPPEGPPRDARPARPAVFLAVMSASVAIFIVAAVLALQSEPYAFDRDMLLALRRADDLAVPVGPPWLAGFARAITDLGGTPILTVMTLGLAGYFIVKREGLSLSILIAAAVGQTLIVNILKDLFGRERPDITPHLVEVSSASFPSGHSASSAAIFLTLAALTARRTNERSARRYIWSVAIVLALMVGASRVYLGVHYPTDVIGGLAFGAGWAALVLFAADALERRQR